MNHRERLHRQGLAEGRNPDTGAACYVPSDEAKRAADEQIAGELANVDLDAAVAAAERREEGRQRITQEIRLLVAVMPELQQNVRALRHRLNQLQHQAKASHPQVGVIAAGVDEAIGLWREIARPLGIEY